MAIASFKGVQSWWGGRLACLADSLIQHVRLNCKLNILVFSLSSLLQNHVRTSAWTVSWAVFCMIDWKLKQQDVQEMTLTQTFRFYSPGSKVEDVYPDSLWLL